MTEEHLQLCALFYFEDHFFLFGDSLGCVLQLLLEYYPKPGLCFGLAQCGQEGLSECALVIGVCCFLVLISIPHNFYVVFYSCQQ